MLVTFGLGALAMYLFDPQQGRSRRERLRDGLSRARRWVGARTGEDARTLSYREYVVGTQAPAAEPAKPVEAPQGARHLGR
jgi:hypothetical protein